MRVGIDAQSIAEVREALEAHGDRYRRRIFSEREIEQCGGWGSDADSAASSLAARFATKEAVLKVLRDLPRIPAWPDMEVVTSPGGWPRLHLHGIAAELADAAGLTEFEISLTHTADTAVAVVIAQ